MWYSEVANVEGLCQPLPMAGPLGQEQHFAWTAAGNLRWSWRCAKCNAQAHDAGRALALVQQGCKADRKEIEVTKGEHEEDAGGLCKWCRADLHQSRAAKCQAPRVHRAGVEDAGAAKEVWRSLLRIQALRFLATGKWRPGLSTQQALRAWATEALAPDAREVAAQGSARRNGCGAEVGEEHVQQAGSGVQCMQEAQPAPCPAPAPSGEGAAGARLQPYAGHWRVACVSVPGRVAFAGSTMGAFCLKCAGSPRKGAVAGGRWASEPCPGERDLPRRYRDYLAELPEEALVGWPQAWKAWRLRVV